MTTSNQPNSTTSGSDSVGLPTPADAAPRYEGESAIVDAARRVGETVLGPNAQEADRAPAPLLSNFHALAEAGLLGMSLPREYGGLDASGPTQREVTEILASYCGVTTFTQAQHHGPSRMICSGPNQHLKGRAAARPGARQTDVRRVVCAPAASRPACFARRTR